MVFRGYMIYFASASFEVVAKGMHYVIMPFVYYPIPYVWDDAPCERSL